MSNFFSSSKLLRINNEEGDILRVLRKTEESFTEFGEAYFSIIHMNSIKAWKKHNAMTMNLIVPTGCVGFVFTDGKDFKSVKIGPNNYLRITVPPGVWFGFKGLSSDINLVLNIADMVHSSEEVEKKEKNYFKFDWSSL